jgi:hypothetical protein
MPSSLRARQASWLLRRQPWFYPRLVAYGYSGYPRHLSELVKHFLVGLDDVNH